MTKRIEDVERLIAELGSDLADLADLERRNLQARRRIEAGARDDLDWAALGYTIHNIYGVMENYFLRIAKFFENRLDAPFWHRELQQRMTLDIPGVRPALFARDTTGPIEELRAFRHVFRNLYARPLDPAKVELAQKQVLPALALLRQAHEAYCGKLRRIAEASG